jgi:hypothetical protein
VNAWPQWLQGDPNQTLLYLPRVLHNFKAATDVGTGGFHQVFNELFRASRFATEEGIAINNADAWAAYLGAEDTDRTLALTEVSGLMRTAYQRVLGPLLPEAEALFNGEVDTELAELKKEA